MKTRDALRTLDPATIDRYALHAQGREELRKLLGVGGLLGRAVNAHEERCALAAWQGLRDGWIEGDDLSAYYEGEERAWYVEAYAVGLAAWRAQSAGAEERAA